MGAFRRERAWVRTLAGGGEPAGWGTRVLGGEDRLWIRVGVGGWEETHLMNVLKAGGSGHGAWPQGQGGIQQEAQGSAVGDGSSRVCARGGRADLGERCFSSSHSCT